MASTILAHKRINLVQSTHGTNARTKEGEIRASDVLIDRNNQIRHITKSHIAYFTGLAAIEHNTAKSLIGLTSSDIIQVPFHEGHAFLGEGGQQASLYALRDQTKVLSDLHTKFAATIESETIVELQAARTDLKARIALLQKEAGTLTLEVEKEREISAGHLTQLQQGIDTFENSTTHMLPQHDPYVTHIVVSKQLAKQVHQENLLQELLIKFQQEQPAFETSIFNNIKAAAKKYDLAKAAHDKEIAAVQAEIAAEIQRVEPNAEYNHFVQHDTSLIDPNTPLRSLENISFPGIGHPSTIPIKEGQLERKKRFTKSYKESFYVLTPSGYLQERKTSNDDDPSSVLPTFSLFLPECTLGQPAKESDKSHKFHLEGNKAHKSTFESKFKAGFRMGGHEHAYSFRSRTHKEMLGWWSELDKLSRDTSLPAVATPKKAINPISYAVANVGRPAPVAAITSPVSPVSSVIVHHVEEEEDDEEGGSSAEEEEELARTAPTTPAAGLHLTEDILPVYAGTGTTAAEKAGLHEKGAPVLGAIASENPDAEASTSKGWFA